MKYVHLLAANAVMVAALIFAATKAHAEGAALGPRNNFAANVGGVHTGFNGGMHGGFHGGHHGHFGGFGGVWIEEREVPVIVEVPVQAPPPQAVPLPPGGEAKERKPYVIGASYDSLPGGCMKLIEDGASFFYCSGEWYREVRAGRSPLYRAVDRKL